VKCPKCETELAKERRHGLDVDACPAGHGTWLDLVELDRLEDKGYDEDEMKGSLVFRAKAVGERCPQCGAALMRFQYRLNELHLEYCPAEHGYWLDAGEDERIVALMNEREADLDRKSDAEAEWSKTLNRLRSQSLVEKVRRDLRPGVFDRIRNLFR
jgi:Zn-finger nucleic acid-binding protein